MTPPKQKKRQTVGGGERSDSVSEWTGRSFTGIQTLAKPRHMARIEQMLSCAATLRPQLIMGLMMTMMNEAMFFFLLRLSQHSNRPYPSAILASCLSSALAISSPLLDKCFFKYFHDISDFASLC